MSTTDSRGGAYHEPVTLKDKIVSAGLWAAGISWIVPSFGTMMALQTFLRSDQIEPVNRLYTSMQIALTGSKFRAVVHSDVDPNQVYMFATNHVNHFDHCTMYCSTPHFKQGLELEAHFKYPVYGWFMKQRGTIPVRRGFGAQTRKIMDQMRRELEMGHSILAFPEGTRTRDGRVRPFKRGVFQIARDLGIPIVPVAVTGMQHVMRADSWIIRPGNTVTVYCDEPISSTGDEPIRELAKKVRAPIAARVDAYLQEHASSRGVRA
ncbi:MAG: 1-acyl-sn-glycerol-3-phosphate acyltransferase [Deltaproteobacteria bacterium]|nr:1-acyl-sn-glycerol-3-phosphate acyltransferase [Deltaproteobacteria bacterium]